MLALDEGTPETVLDDNPRATASGSQDTSFSGNIDIYGLDRIDQDQLPLDGTYSWDKDGTGVDAYIVDTGIQLTHNEFGGRASCGYSYYNDACEDGNGHG